ncbi:MAG TPA: antitoxin VapB family protein [archaeon]|nr:antitoxin VapB family protein [archaeon]
MVKTITVTNDAYEALKKLKMGDESFSEVIRRVAKPTFNIKDYFGILPREGAEEAQKKLREIKVSFSKDMEERRKRVHSR